MHAKVPRIVPIILLAGLAVFLTWYFLRGAPDEAPGSLTASGTIEAVRFTLASEVGGRAAAVSVQKGERVSTGQVLVRLDDQVMQAQLAQAQAQLGLAQAAYAQVAAGAPPEQVAAAVAAAKVEQLAAEQTLAELGDTYTLQAANFLLQIAQADKALDQAEKRVTTLNSESDPADIDAARAQVTLAKDKLDKAIDDYEPYENKAEDNLVRAALLAKMAEAQQRYDQLVEKLNNLLGKTSNLDMSVAEANQILLNAQLSDAQRRYDAVKDGPDPDAVSLAQARLEAAQAQIAAAQSGPTPEQLALAQAQVDAAQAAVDLLEVQVSRLTLVAPTDGSVLERSVEPGEVVMAGAPLLTLANLDALTLTVYLPEDRYGEIQLGDEAAVWVDSFPGERFTARVIRIADQAEFTPRNVQTAEGRKTTVFAVELSLDNAENRLKPGMPADVSFE